MATVTKIRKVANPGRRKRYARSKSGRFVKKSFARRKLRRRVKVNTPRRKRYTKRANAHRRREQNPMLLELGMVNPRRRRNSVAKKRKYSRAKKTSTRRRRRANAAPRVYRRRRRISNPVHHVRKRRTVRHHRRRYAVNRRRRSMNPFGHSTKDLMMMSGGILVGVAATKYLPTLIPASMMPAQSPIMSVVITGAGAVAAGWLAKRFVSPQFGDAVLLGGLALTGSRLLDAFAPASISRQLTLSGVGDIVPGYFTVPQNSVTNRAPVIAMPSAGSGVGAFRGAFGNRR